MTDIAAIFHWSHAELAAMSLPELLAWQRRAVGWFNEAHKTKR